MSGAVSALAVLGVLALVGSPIALSIRGTQPEWTGLAFESVVIGLVIELLIAIVALHAGHYSPPTALVLTVLVVGGATFAVRRMGERDGAPPADLSLLKRAQPAAIGAATLVLVVVALSIRRAPSYFIFQTGDMGGYVNSANILTYASRFGTSLHGFTVFLRATNLLLGTSHTVAGLPALGLILLLGVIAYARTIGSHAAVVLGIGFLVAVHPVTSWFSLFPVSESLSAPLLVAALYLVVRARAETSNAYAVLGGIVVGTMLLVRGEAVLFAPIVVLVLLASTAFDDDATLAVQRRFTFVSLVSLLLAYAYDVHYAHAYFESQLRNLLPGFLFRFAVDARLIDLSVFLVVAGAIALAIVLRLCTLVARKARPRALARPRTMWRYTYDVVAAVALISLVLFPLFGLGHALLTWGPLLLGLAVIGLVAVVQRPGEHLDTICSLMVVMVIGLYVVLFARRVPDPKDQTYYLYFQRYLFSEVLPAALLVAGIGLQVIVDVCERFSPTSQAFRAAVAAVMVVVLIGLVPQMDETRRTTQYQLFGDAYGALRNIDRLTRDDNDDAGAVVYSGSKTAPDGWFYANTFRAFALPLHQTFNRQVYGIPNVALAKDLLFDPAGARRALQRHGVTSGYLVALRLTGPPQYDDDDHTRYVSTVTYECPSLGQTAHSPQPPWSIAIMHFDVYAIS